MMDNLGKVEIGSPIWIDQQRAVCDKVKREESFALPAAEKMFMVDMPAALDALEAAYVEIARLTAERDAEKRRADAAIPENLPLTSEKVMTLDDLDAVWLYSWGRSTPVTVESGRCAKAMLECPPKDKSPYGSDWWFFEHKPSHTDIIEAVRHHSDC